MMAASPKPVLHLRIVSALAALFAFALVVWGGIVRINGAGMTCPDWPRCRGVWFPGLSGGVAYEWLHRDGAVLLTILIGATFLAAWRVRRQRPEVARLAWIALGMVVVQILLGAATIRYANNPPSVAAHLVVGVATFVTLLLVWYASGRDATSDAAAVCAVPPPVAWCALAAALGAFFTIVAGGYMSASHAGAACPGLPLCRGWTEAAWPLARIHMLHRFGAYATLAAVLALVGVAFASPRTPRDVRRLVAAAGVTVGLQVGLGMATVVLGLPAALRSLHQAIGVALGSLLVVTAYRCWSRSPLRDASAAWTGVRSYVELTKPNVMSLLLFTTLTAMLMASRGHPRLWLVIWTLVGGALASASSASINMYLDRDIDALMSRTRLRPIPSGRVSPGRALAFGIAMGVAACVVFGIAVNLLAAVLALAGILYYVFVYTLWLKRTTPQNIVIGGAAGAIPPLVGWAAVSGHLGLTAYALFLIVFIWTPPHFWSLALMKKDEYARVGIPMLPSVRGEAVTKRQILVYSGVLVALTIALVPLHLMGMPYLGAALVLNALFVAGAVWVARTGTKRSEGWLYRFSMLYLALLFSAMVVDRVIG